MWRFLNRNSSLLILPAEVSISIRMQLVEAIANLSLSSGRAVHISQGRINKSGAQC